MPKCCLLTVSFQFVLINNSKKNEKWEIPGSSRSWGSWRRRQWGRGAEPRFPCRSERRGVLAASDASLAQSHPWPTCSCPGTVRPARCSSQGEWPCRWQLLHSHTSKTDGTEIPRWPAFGEFSQAFRGFANMTRQLWNIPENCIHSSPLKASGTPRTIRSRVFRVKNMLVPRPYSEKWMFHDCSFIFSLSCQSHSEAHTTLFRHSLYNYLCGSSITIHVAHPWTPTRTPPACRSVASLQSGRSLARFLQLAYCLQQLCLFNRHPH